MTNIDILVKFISMLLGFASLLTTLIFLKDKKHRVLKHYFEGYLFLFLFHLTILFHGYLKSSYDLTYTKDLIIGIVLFYIESRYVVNAVKLTSDVLKLNRPRIVGVICKSVTFIYLLAYLLSFNTENMKDLVGSVYTNLWYCGLAVRIPVLALCIIFIVKNYKSVENVIVKKMIRAFLFLLMFYIPLIITEHILKSMFLWPFANTTIKVLHLGFIAWSVISGYILFRSINSNLANDSKSEVFNSYGFTQREEDVLKQMLNSESAHEIGSFLFISPRTVEKHISNIYKKARVSSRSELLDVMKVLV